MNYEQMIETLDIIEFQRRKNWYVHETTYDLLIKQLKKCKRLDEGSLLDWLLIYFVTLLILIIIFSSMLIQLSLRLSMLFILIYAVAAYFFAVCYVYIYKIHVMKKFKHVTANLEEKDLSL